MWIERELDGGRKRIALTHGTREQQRKNDKRMKQRVNP